MGLTPQQSLMLKYDYYEVFDKNKVIRYGITSKEDKDIIEEKHPNKYIFDKIDLYDNYVWLDKLEERSNLRFMIKNSFELKIKILIISLLILSIILDFLLIY